MKTCNRCGEGKARSEYRKDRTKSDGLQTLCKSCRAQYEAQWRAENKDLKRSRAADYRAANKDKERARYDAWVRRNRGKYLAYQSQYRKDNPHAYWASCYRRRAVRHGLPVVIEDFTKPDVIDRYGDECFYCEDGDFEQLDHAIPVSKGGPHTLDNVRPSCFQCNRSKSDMTDAEWQAKQADLDRLTDEELEEAIDAEVERWTA